MHLAPVILQAQVYLHPGGKLIAALSFQRIPLLLSFPLLIEIRKAQAADPVADGQRTPSPEEVPVAGMVLAAEEGKSLLPRRSVQGITEFGKAPPPFDGNARGGVKPVKSRRSRKSFPSFVERPTRPVR